MKKTLSVIIVLLFFSVPIVIGCAPTNVQKDQNLNPEETKKVAEPSSSYKDIEGKLIELDTLFKKGLISEDEYYKTRAKVLEDF
jgi:hypothetical protein